MMSVMKTTAMAVMAAMSPMATLSAATALVGRLFGSVLWRVRDGVVTHLLITTSRGRRRGLALDGLGLGLLLCTPWPTAVGKWPAVVVMKAATAMAMGSTAPSCPGRASRARAAAVSASAGPASKEGMFGGSFCLLFEVGDKVPEGSGLVDVTN
jgi:hypothetical protein